MVALSWAVWLTSAGAGGAAGAGSTGSELRGPLFLTTLPSKMLHLAVRAPPTSPPVALGGLRGHWGPLGHLWEVLETDFLEKIHNLYIFDTQNPQKLVF